MLIKSRRHAASKVLGQVPTLSTVRSAQLIAVVATPHRLRSKRQFWSYCGLAVKTRSSANHHFIGGDVRQTAKTTTRGLTQDHNRTLKYVFKSAALTATRCEPFKSYDDAVSKVCSQQRFGVEYLRVVWALCANEDRETSPW
jgi:transposase